jgi:hypothetical protein
MEHLVTQAPISSGDVDRFIAEADAAEHLPVPEAALEELDTDEIISVMRFARGHEHDGGWVGGLDNQLTNTISDVIKTNPVRARELMTALAESRLVDDRQDAAGLVIYLTHSDHDLGVALWDQLIRDHDKEVREIANDWLDVSMDDDEPWDEGHRDSYGISWDEAVALRMAHQDAEHGVNVHDPQRAAFEELIGAMSRLQDEHPTEFPVPHGG